MGPLEHFICDFFAAMGRQAMHHNGAIGSTFNQSAIYPKWRKYGGARFTLRLLSHAEPGIGVDHIRFPHCRDGIIANRDVGVRHSSSGDSTGIWLVTLRTGNLEPKACQRRGFDQGTRDIVPIANIRHRQTINSTESLANRQQVCQDLTWVASVGKSIDDRHRRGGSERLEIVVEERAGHQSSTYRLSTRPISDGASRPPSPTSAGGKVKTVPPELVCRYLE